MKMYRRRFLLKSTSKNVIPAKAGIQKLLTSLDSQICRNNKLIIIRGSLKSTLVGWSLAVVVCLLCAPAFAEQYVAWHLLNAPRISTLVILTKIEMIGY